MPRPKQNMVTFSIDGREVTAPENAMLVDAAKYGDVEIPVFCYEPKLGQPVGACRMCLVEVEGIPKLQTGCSTPIKDGMVVHTATERVREAQEAVVEFLLVNHPLDCPVCDKGGECPLQDISFGWGAGKSRFIEPKRHFVKPLQLSPLIAIDRERCILCYRCVRFSQEVAEDFQLVLVERGAHSYVSTFDGHPYVAPFSGNIIELCPVGALTSTAYRFRARPWDIEGGGSVCTLCPAQCNVSFTVRDERVLRVLNRHHDDVDDGWLCDKGRFAYQSIHADERIVEPLVRDGGELRPASWERALETAAAGLARAKGKAAALAEADTSNEEAFLLGRLMREGLESPDVDCRAGGTLPVELWRALAAPGLQATVPDLEFAHMVLVVGADPIDDAPIVDLRIRKGVRRCGVRLAVATDRPGALDPNAERVVRFEPGGAEGFLAGLDAALAGGGGEGDVGELARALRDAGEDIVIVYGDRLLAGPRAEQAAQALLNLAARLGLDGRDGAGLLELPASANGRGLREAGLLPNAGPGYGDAPAGRSAPEIARALDGGDLAALYLMHSDPLRTHPDRALWERALSRATLVISHESVMTDTVREHANVVFPADAYAEKEGTVVHPDGRLQRLRPAIGRPPHTRAAWWVLNEIADRVGLELGVTTGSDASAQLFDAVPFYGGLTPDEIGGQGVRWPEREQASALPEGATGPFELESPVASRQSPVDGALRLGTFRSLWASPAVEISPALQFLVPRQRVELSPDDAQRLGIGEGDRVEVAQNGYSVRGTASLRNAIPAGTVFLAEGTVTDSANAIDDGQPRAVEVRRA